MTRDRRSIVLLLTASAAVFACTPMRVADPAATLGDVKAGAARHRAAVAELERRDDGETIDDAVVHDVLWHGGYTPAVRGAAFDYLLARDPEALKRTLQRQLPYVEGYRGLTILCERIADAGWVECAPALVRSLARPVAGVPDAQRPEYLALSRLWGGPDRVAPGVLELVLTERGVARQGLRTRGWELMHRLGERDELRRAVRAVTPAPDDLFLIDLRRGDAEFGIFPHTREEILWLRTLYQPEYDPFRAEAQATVRSLGAGVELRDLPVLVHASRHDRQRMQLDDATLYYRLESSLAGRRHYRHESNFNTFNAGRRERIEHWRGELTRGDLLALIEAVALLDEALLVAHLFEYAERDRADETTEYGGVLTRDDSGAGRVLEFPPRVRRHDQEFLASQEMIDAAYTGLFHFHFHAQRYRNEDFAGPGYGDTQYAEHLRANCLVLTFVRPDEMNVDFYRHGGVRVDLGVVHRVSARISAMVP